MTGLKRLTGKVDRFLDLMASSRDPDVRRMVVSTEGAGDRSLFVSYISEVPIWKATYRLVIGSGAGQNPLLQGWASVDNTVGQDWENVQLSLVAGAPQSFMQNLSQPYYSRRPVVALPESIAVSPQTFESTLMPGSARVFGTVADPSGAAIAGATVRAYDANGTVAMETKTKAAGGYELGLLEGNYRLEFQHAGFRNTTFTGIVASNDSPVQKDVRLDVGSVTQTVDVSANALPLQTESASVASAGGKNLGSGVALGGTRNQFTRLEQFGKLQSSPPVQYTVDAARARAQSAATAQELGDLFEYKLTDPVTILKNKSALVPIVQSAIGAEKVSVWNEQAGLPRPQRALWLSNSTGLTLDGGSFSVLDDETFAGEGVFDPIRPDEKRLISYAVDLALNVNARQSTEQQRVTRAVVNRGTMTQHSEVREKKTYTFRNEDSSPRTVIVEHPARGGYELRGDVRPVETTPTWMRFRLQVKPKETASIVVEEARPLQTTYALTNINSQQVDLFVRQQSIDKTVEAALRKILAQKTVVEDLDEKKTARESETEKIFDDQQRLRENMKALKGSPEEKTLVQRYTRQLNDQEDRLDALKREIEQLESQHDAAEMALDQMIQEISFDVNL